MGPPKKVLAQWIVVVLSHSHWRLRKPDVGEKGPHTKTDRLRGGLTNSETESNHKGWSESNPH